MNSFIRRNLGKLSNIVRITHAARANIALVYAIAAFIFVRPGGVTTEESVAVLSFVILTFATYLFNRAMDAESDAKSQPGEVLEGRSIVISSLVLFFAPIVFLVAFSLPVLPYLLFVPVGILYSVPIWNGRALRCVFLVKNVYAAAGWWASFAVLQSVYAGVTTFPEALVGTLDVFLLILAVEIIWDIRDTHADKEACVETLPNTIGIPSTRVVLAVLLLGILALRGVTLGDPIVWAAITLLLLSASATPATPRWIFHTFIYIIVAALLAVVVFI